MADFDRIALSALPQLDRFASGLARGFTARAQAEAARRERAREQRVAERAAAAKRARDERAMLTGLTQDALEDTIQSLSGRGGKRTGSGGSQPAVTVDTRGDLQRAIVDVWDQEITELLRARGVPDSDIRDPAKRAGLIEAYRLPSRPLSRHEALARETFNAQAPQAGSSALAPGGAANSAAARQYAGLQAVEPLVRQLAGGAGVRRQFVDEMFPGQRMTLPPEGLQRPAAPAFQPPPGEQATPQPAEPSPGQRWLDFFTQMVPGAGGQSGAQAGGQSGEQSALPAPRDLRPTQPNLAWSGPTAQSQAAAAERDPASHIDELASLYGAGENAAAYFDPQVVDQLRPEWSDEKRRAFKAALVNLLTQEVYSPEGRATLQNELAQFKTALIGAPPPLSEAPPTQMNSVLSGLFGHRSF